MATTLTKIPSEVRYFGMDFSNKSNDFEKISTVEGYTVSPTGPTLSNFSFKDLLVRFLVTGGTANTKYGVSITVTTSLGQTLVNTGTLHVK